MKKFLIALVLGFLVAGPVYAAPVCLSFQEGVDALKAEAPRAQVVELTASQRDALAKEYNAADPPTNEVFSHIYTISEPGDRGVLVVFVERGDCVFTAIPLSKAALAEAIGGDT